MNIEPNPHVDLNNARNLPKVKSPTHAIKLQPFRVPNYVLAEMPAGLKEVGFREGPKFHLSELSSETLEKLCADFRDGVMRKAAAGEEPVRIVR